MLNLGQSSVSISCDEIKARIARLGKTQRWLAGEIGRSYGALRNMLCCQDPLTPWTKLQILEAIERAEAEQKKTQP